MSAAPNYPLPPCDEDDRRFNYGLFFDIGKVLEEHGFPKLSGVDHVDLMLALFRFVYATEDRPVPVQPVSDDDRAMAQRAELHLDLPNALLVDLAVSAVHATVTP
jgi:hypothetical protein